MTDKNALVMEIDRLVDELSDMADELANERNKSLLLEEKLHYVQRELDAYRVAGNYLPEDIAAIARTRDCVRCFGCGAVLDRKTAWTHMIDCKQHPVATLVAQCRALEAQLAKTRAT